MASPMIKHPNRADRGERVAAFAEQLDRLGEQQRRLADALAATNPEALDLGAHLDRLAEQLGLTAEQVAAMHPGVGYLRLSDPDNELALEGRADLLRTAALRDGVRLLTVLVENDFSPGAVAGGPIAPASAHKRRRVKLANGDMALRTFRPGFRHVLDLIRAGVVTHAYIEDLDRLLRQPRDGEDLLDDAELARATLVSLSGTVRLTRGGTPDERFMLRLMANVASKASSDTARRVAAARARLAGISYGGGVRPFGFEPDPDAAQYRKTLLHRPPVNEGQPSEADELVAAAAGLLRSGATLKGIARDWNARGVETVAKGGRWDGSKVRDVLLKPAVAGLTWSPRDEQGERVLITAPWKPILDRDTWDELTALLTAEARRVSPGNQPRWLVSVWARCGACGGKTRVTGTSPKPTYQCSARGCVGRLAGSSDNLTELPRGVDDLVAQLVVARLCEPDAADLARPAPSLPEREVARLRAERAELLKRRTTQATLHASGLLTDEALVAGARTIAEHLGVIERNLALASTVDPLAEFRAAPGADRRPPAEVWLSLPIERRRAVAQLLIESVTILPVNRHGARVFNPASVVVVPRSFG